jgi:hypothetical protein
LNPYDKHEIFLVVINMTVFDASREEQRVVLPKTKPGEPIFRLALVPTREVSTDPQRIFVKEE